MKHSGSLILGIVILVTAVAAQAEQFARVGTFGGQFARIPVDARGEAMGLATTVNPQGPLAFWWNPAPLPESDRVEASLTVRDWVGDLDWRPMAVRASRGNLTFGMMWGRLSSDDLVVRTAYEPDGDGETFKIRDDLVLLSGAADLVPWLTDGPSPWVWSVGASARYLHEELVDETTSTLDADLGTTVARTLVDDPALRLRVMGTAMVRNLLAGSLDDGEVESKLPRHYHFGLGLDAGLGGQWHGEPLLLMTVSHTWRRYLEDEYYGTDSEHLGLELLLAGVASVRLGYRDPALFLVDGWNWGAGVQWRFEQWHGARIAVDYAHTDLEDFIDLDEGDDFYPDLDIWTVTLGLDLP